MDRCSSSPACLWVELLSLKNAQVTRSLHLKWVKRSVAKFWEHLKLKYQYFLEIYHTNIFRLSCISHFAIRSSRCILYYINFICVAFHCLRGWFISNLSISSATCEKKRTTTLWTRTPELKQLLPLAANTFRCSQPTLSIDWTMPNLCK